MWRLYGTEGCHLCEQAAAQLGTLQIPFISIDIATDEALLRQYALMIPVVVAPNDQSLAWPFSTDDLAKLLENQR